MMYRFRCNFSTNLGPCVLHDVRNEQMCLVHQHSDLLTSKTWPSGCQTLDDHTVMTLTGRVTVGLEGVPELRTEISFFGIRVKGSQ